MSALRSRTQPLETFWPIRFGALVPWIASWPPPAQSVRWREKPFRPRAHGPYGRGRGVDHPHPLAQVEPRRRGVGEAGAPIATRTLIRSRPSS